MNRDDRQVRRLAGCQPSQPFFIESELGAFGFHFRKRTVTGVSLDRENRHMD